MTVLLDPPANLTVVSTGNQGELIVSWLPRALKYFDDSYMYEIRYEAKGNPMRKVKKKQFLLLSRIHSSTIDISVKNLIN